MSNQLVLVCESDPQVITLLQKSLSDKWSFEYVSNGREAQAKVYKQSFNVVFLDIDLENHSGIEVLRYIKTAKPQVRVVLVSPTKARIEELGFDQKDLQRMGVIGPLIKPVSARAMEAILEDLYRVVAWKDVQEVGSNADHKESVIGDTKFTRIKTDEFFSGQVSVFDIYLRLGKDKYLKLFNKGETYNVASLKKYAESPQGEWLYFLTAERAAFINYLNDLASKAMSSPKFTPRQRLGMLKNIADQFVSEIETRGLQPEIVEEGKKMCESMLTMVRDDKTISKLMKEFEEVDPKIVSESFLTALFSSMIVSKLPWGSKSTNDKVVMGALLHDLGVLKLPPHLREKKEKDLNGKDLEMWRQHPRLGVEMLDVSPTVPEAVKQIVYQHHELVNGSGFPNGLTGLRIYPLAKIVGFAHGMAEILRHEKLAPLEGVKALLSRRDELEKYDPLMIKSFLMCFSEKDKTKKSGTP